MAPVNHNKGSLQVLCMITGFAATRFLPSFMLAVQCSVPPARVPWLGWHTSIFAAPACGKLVAHPRPRAVGGWGHDGAPVCVGVVGVEGQCPTGKDQTGTGGLGVGHGEVTELHSGDGYKYGCTRHKRGTTVKNGRRLSFRLHDGKPRGCSKP